ncbi:CHAT domain-containing protein [Streptomyces sp. NPDC032940]|uniref:CHAT domain-containing protein n=1 Tax=Streptomyces sp. NPDC032940 TaxID=3155366 RepID=UPI0033FD283E
MADEVREGDGDAGAAKLRREAGEALLEARRLLDVGGGWPSADALGPVIDRLARIESALAEKGADFSVVFVHLGILRGARCLSRFAHGSSDAADREEALRRLRWTDGAGSAADMLAVQARMMLVFLLAPWALPRADGTRTALLDALLAAADGQVLTASLHRDLTEALEVVRRIAAAPLNADLRRVNARIEGDIERMLAVRSESAPARSETSAAGTEAGGTASGGARCSDAPEDARDPEEALFEAVRGLVALAGSCGTARFTRVLVWLITVLQSGPGTAGDDSHEELELEPRARPLLRLAATGAAAGTAGVRRAAGLSLRALRALPPDTPERARVARLHAYLLVVVELEEPGSVDFSAVERPVVETDDDGDRLADWPTGVTPEPGLLAHLDSHLRDFVAHIGIRERRYAACFDRFLAHRTGDTGYLDDASVLLREALEASPDDSWWVLAVRAELADVVAQAAFFDGSFHDADVSLAAVRALGDALESDASLPPDAPFAVRLALSTAERELDHAQRTGDHAALPRVAEELRSRLATLPEDSDLREKLGRRLAQLDGLLADTGRTPGPATLPAGGAGDPATGAGDPATGAGDPAAVRESLVHAIAETRRELGEPEVYHAQEYDRRARLGLQLLFTVVTGDRDPAVLDEAITQLTRARVLLAEGRGRAHRVDVLTKLAEAHARRAARGGPRTGEDLRAFVEVTREALGELAADVLLQIGADHGLSAALNGAVLSRRLAYAACWSRRPADAVADLEKGRALVLQAAAASRSIPELLTATGHVELARQWRAQVLTDPLRPRPGEAPAPPPGGPPIPSGLRRRALAALGVRPGAGGGAATRRFVGTADVAELTAGLLATDTDALVYLLPGMPVPSRPLTGHALILRPGANPAMLSLPDLMLPGSAPLERYLDAAAERSRTLADPDAGPSRQAACEERWQAALDELCDWAGRAVMEPVLAAVGPAVPGGARGPADRVPADRVPRIVLVPCDRLGVVPWHAARLPGRGDGGHRYACQEAVLSYAASGTQFLAAAASPRMPADAGRQVLVADPELTLPWAEVETTALRAACYPDALRYGEFVATDEEPDAAGTPAELLAALPGGAEPASVIHLSCHALAAPRPTDSALWLARPPGGDRDAGRLTVAGILDGASGRRPGTAGPLVVLSACETDLSTRHHDEAMTLATALVARGAADVVGSRWAVRDGPSAVMTAVFHHHLTAGGLAPPDALRAAQLWMLDPRRKLPAAIDGPLRHEATRPDLGRLHHWAAFTHQGNPAPAAG